jgi:hypothetical protein
MELPSSAMDVPVSKSPISESASNIMLSIQPEYDGIRRDHTHSLTEKVNRGRAGKKQGAWVRMMLAVSESHCAPLATAGGACVAYVIGTTTTANGRGRETARMELLRERAQHLTSYSKQICSL